MTTPPKKTNSATSVHALNTRLGVHRLQDLHAGVAVGAELFTKMGTALSSMAKVMSPLLKGIMTTLAEERYWSNFDTNYWLVRDDAPVPVERVKGWDGLNANPHCYNCEHDFTRHIAHRVVLTPRRNVQEELRRNGGVAVCDKNGCTCTHFDPSYVEWQ